MTYKYFFDFFNEHLNNYDDKFGHSDFWNKEIDKWLKLLYELDENFYNKGKTRISNAKNRDEFLGEVKSIYYCKNFLKGNNIKLEPVCNGKNELDFSYIKDGEIFFVEVKSPSWRGEVFKDSDLTHNEKIKRLKKPQYLKSGGGSYTPKDAIEDSIKNSLSKFVKNQKNILMITPNMKVPVCIHHNRLLKSMIKDELNKQDTDNLISGVAFLEVSHYFNKTEMEYEYKFFKNNKI